MPGECRFDERHDDALRASPGRSAGTMCVGLGIFGWIVVHHDIHTIHVDAAGRDIRRHQDRLHAASEGAQGPFALGLAQTTVQGSRTDTGSDQFARQAVRGALGAHEQQRSLRVRGNRDSDIDLGFWGHPDEAMLHRGNVLVLGDDFVVNGVVLVALDEPVDVSIESRREEERLVLVFDPAKNALHLGHEPHVGHLVGLVEDNHAHIVERECAPVEQVVEAAGRGDDDVDAGPEDVSLAVQRCATVDGGDANATGHRDRGQCPGYLAGKFTRRDEDD